MEKHKHPFLIQRNSKVRLLEDFLNHQGLIVAFDFDNTIYDYHKKGDDYSEVVNLLKKCCKLGFTMILFTTSSDEEKIEEKKKYCEELGIRVDFVNESPVLNGTKKPYYNILLDDRAGLLEAFDNLSFVVECVEHSDVVYTLTKGPLRDDKVHDMDDYLSGYKRGLIDGKNEALVKLQENNKNTDLPSNETLYKIFSLYETADRKMKESCSCYMNRYEYYAGEIAKNWNDGEEGQDNI